MKLICGLGNPGAEHARDRHNAGFLVVERLAARLCIPLDSAKFDGRLGAGRLGEERLLLLLPETYMNLSGTSVAAAARFYKLEPTDLLVVHDELDLPFGRLQLKRGGGTAGHKGLGSVVSSLGQEGFLRLRVGVGKPEGKEKTVGHVLSGFTQEERTALPELLERAAEACVGWATLPLAEVMTRFNRKG
ncbi:MAG: aminoacyl-tRNA hydrolase [Myxococcaceae bacterium]